MNRAATSLGEISQPSCCLRLKPTIDCSARFDQEVHETFTDVGDQTPPRTASA